MQNVYSSIQDVRKLDDTAKAKEEARVVADAKLKSMVDINTRLQGRLTGLGKQYEDATGEVKILKTEKESLLDEKRSLLSVKNDLSRQIDDRDRRIRELEDRVAEAVKARNAIEEEKQKMTDEEVPRFGQYNYELGSGHGYKEAYRIWLEKGKLEPLDEGEESLGALLDIEKLPAEDEGDEVDGPSSEVPTSADPVSEDHVEPVTLTENAEALVTISSDTVAESSQAALPLQSPNDPLPPQSYS